MTSPRKILDPRLQVHGLNHSHAIGFDFDEAVTSTASMRAVHYIRRRTLAVPVSLILRLADIIRATGCGAENVGHAVWHLENPDRELPCRRCETWTEAWAETPAP